MRGEVKALLKRAEEVDEQAAPEIDMPAQRARPPGAAAGGDQAGPGRD